MSLFILSDSDKFYATLLLTHTVQPEKITTYLTRYIFAQTKSIFPHKSPEIKPFRNIISPRLRWSGWRGWCRYALSLTALQYDRPPCHGCSY